MLSSLEGIPSGPVDLCGSILTSRSYTPLTSIESCSMLEIGSPLIIGTVEWSSLVKTETN